MADFAINNNVLINFNSHDIEDIEKEYLNVSEKEKASSLDRTQDSRTGKYPHLIKHNKDNLYLNVSDYYGKLEDKKENNSLSFKPNSFDKSSVEYTEIDFCLLCPGSLDQSGQFSESANANGAMSLSCGANCLASDSNFLCDSEGINLIYFSSSLNVSLISSLFDLEYFRISDSLSFNSSKTYAGENNWKLNNLELIMKYLAGDVLPKNVNNTLESTTNIIYQPSFLYLFQTALFTFLPSFNATSSVSSEFSNILSNFLSTSNLLTLSDSNPLISLDQLTSGSFSISCFNGSDIDNVTFGILLPPQYLINTQDTQIFKSFGFKEVPERVRENVKMKVSRLLNPTNRLQGRCSSESVPLKILEGLRIYKNFGDKE